ncbi:MAG: AI-2E family transporter, partial [Bacteroidia bacterium]
SNSVKAHPLEIFIVTLMAATIGGIFGMVVALPVYTIIRIIAKEFLTHLKFFKKISDTIEEE